MSDGAKAFLFFAVLGAAWAGFAWHEEIGTAMRNAYEQRFEPATYWRKQVDARRFHVQAAELQQRECLIDLHAARMKEPLRVEMNLLLGVGASNATTWAREETRNQEGLCEVSGQYLDRERLGLADAEHELSVARR